MNLESSGAYAPKEKLGFLLIGGVILAPILVFAAFLLWSMRSPVALRDPKRVTITAGAGFIQISDALASEGVIRSTGLFRMYILGRGWAGSLKPGEYTFGGTISIADVARELLSGPGDTEFLVPEGATVSDIEAGLARMGFVKQGEILALVHSPSIFEEEFPFLKDLEADNLEGFFFPDTYKLNQRMQPEDIVRKFLSAFRDKVFTGLETSFHESPRSILDIVTIASMIEKESADSEDRRIISGILWKRLETDMPLQVDATVIYAWKQVNPSWSLGAKLRLSANDLKINSPFNTYLNKGLPPSPIGNPGFDAIRAALDPQGSDYMYYLSLPDGRTFFSSTYNEHLALKAKYYK